MVRARKVRLTPLIVLGPPGDGADFAHLLEYPRRESYQILAVIMRRSKDDGSSHLAWDESDRMTQHRGIVAAPRVGALDFHPTRDERPSRDLAGNSRGMVREVSVQPRDAHFDA